MKAVTDWYRLDRNRIIDLVIENCTIEKLEYAVEKRIRDHLKAMTPAQLFNHVETNYGTLYGPDIVRRTVEPDHVKDHKPIKRTKAVPIFIERKLEDIVPVIEEAETVLLGKLYVKNVVRVADTLMIAVDCEEYAGRVKRYCRNHYKNVKIEVRVVE